MRRSRQQQIAFAAMTGCRRRFSHRKIAARFGDERPAAASSPDRATPATPATGIIDPVSTFDFRATEFRSCNPDKVAFTIKASQHLR
jgi:hypothetical protein